MVVTIYSMLLLVCALLIRTVHATGGNPCTFTQEDDGMMAHCSHRKLSSLPMTWPSDVSWLDLSDNRLTMSIFEELARHSKFHNLSQLDLGHNNIEGTIAKGFLKRLPRLKVLRLNDNQLVGLDADSMQGLQNLATLELSNNHLQLDLNTFPPRVFDPLVSLQELFLIGNDDRTVGYYPDYAFQSLGALRTFNIDTFVYGHFGPGFLALRNLRSLILGRCKFATLSNSTLGVFKNSSVEKLEIAFRDVAFIDSCALCDFPHLNILKISGASFSSRMQALYGLQHRNMTEIDFSGTHDFHLAILDGSATRFLKNICVSRLNLAANKIRLMKASALGKPGSLLYRCLQFLDMSGNSIAGERGVLNMAFLFFKQLVSIRVEGQFVYSLSDASYILGQDKGTEESQTFTNFSVTIHIPPTLTDIHLSSGIGKIGSLPGALELIPADVVRTIDISYCQCENCLTTFSPLPALETLVISGNNCYNISEGFFDSFPALRHLGMSNLNLNPAFFRTTGWRLFRNLGQLETIDLTLNNLAFMDPGMLQAHPRLKEFKIAGNRLQSLSLDLSLLEELKVLDYKNNMLTTLLQHERNALDKLVHKHSVTLRLRGNPLLCACSNQDFVQWLWATRVTFDGDGSKSRRFPCMTEKGEISDTETAMLKSESHWRHCVGQQALGAASAALLLQLLALLFVYVLTQNWTHVQYVWKVMQRLRLPRREQFRRDAYVGYADADWEFACLTLQERLGVRRGVRLLLRAFEELPGSVRAENIVEHIEDSWKVLLLVTEAFATDEWLCGFTVQQAQRSITDTMPDRVVIVLLQDPARLPPMASLERLLQMVPERNVYYVHKDAPAGDPVWDRLAESIFGRKHHRRGE